VESAWNQYMYKYNEFSQFIVIWSSDVHLWGKLNGKKRKTVYSACCATLRKYFLFILGQNGLSKVILFQIQYSFTHRCSFIIILLY